jgi:hypothetical protein
MGRNENIRVGTAEREQAIAALGGHFAAGRIDVGEYEERCGAASTARTQAELAALFDDLPEQPTLGHTAVEPAPLRNPLIERSNPKNTKAVLAAMAVLAVAVTVGVIAITGAWVALVPALIIGFVFLMLS